MPDVEEVTAAYMNVFIKVASACMLCLCKNDCLRYFHLDASQHEDLVAISARCIVQRSCGNVRCETRG